MRWNNTIVLLSHDNSYQDEMGVWHEGLNTSREVFCNEFSIGANTWANAVGAGYRADAEVQTYAIDYQNEPEAIYKGVEYTVERVQAAGDLVRLQLARKASNE